MKLLATPAFLDEATRHAFIHTPLCAKLLPGPEPSWIVGDPTIKAEVKEDQGRTLRVPAPFPFYIIRDDHGEGPVITALLKEEY
ncbi:MAG TPA: hypothetical protein VF595_12595 [Tepidisphaeraceae bacterium]|jgi:hypothetical protein